MDVDGLAKLGGGGVLGAYGIKLLWSWFTREKQESSLYKNELAAHEDTKKELSNERKLRKDAEMELVAVRKQHEVDRSEWTMERDKDREQREQLKDQVFALRTEVRELKTAMQAKGFDT